MLIKIIAVALLVSVDSFFTTLLVSKKAKIKVLVLCLSPIFHILFCVIGFMTQQSLKSFRGNILGFMVLFFLFIGGYLFFSYKPETYIIKKAGISLTNSAILILLCSIDAMIAGFVYGYWNVYLKDAICSVGGVNLGMILIALLASTLIKPSRKNSQEGYYG